MKLLTAIITLTVLFQLSPSLPATAADNTSTEFRLLYSNNVNGEIEPCG